MKFSIDQIAIAILYLGSVFLLGGMIRRYTPWLRAFFVPVLVVAGFVGLFIGPQVLGQLVPEGHWLENGLLPADTLDIWALLPGILINVVFATILLGKKLPSLGGIWYRSAPQVLFGFTLSFGQYALGMLLAVTVLVPLFGLSPLVGGLLEISFTGGHGTAAGLTSTFDELGFKEGVDLALGLATIGLVTGIVSGTWLINRAPLLLMSFVAIAWSVFAFSFIAPRVFPHRWFEHGMGGFGQSAGTVATGFLLINMSDPNDQTGATESCGCKQLLFEPIVGGGLVTAVSLPLIAAFGPVAMGFSAFILTLIFVGTGMLICKRATKA